MNDNATLYEGTKRLTAAPMTRGDYNAYRGWTDPAGENPSDAGYLVEYQDGGKANDSRHAGYISWSPKDVFERSYKPVLPIESPTAKDYGTAPRVTAADIEAEIDREHYFTAADGARFDWLTANHSSYEQRDAVRRISESIGTRSCSGMSIDIDANSNGVTRPELALLTLCVLVLRNGFTVTGESTCASPENFNAEIGRKIARENAVQKMWPLMGYALKERLHQQSCMVPQKA